MNDFENNYSLIVGVGERSSDHPFMSITKNDALKLKEVLTSRCRFKPQATMCLTFENATTTNFASELDRLIVITRTKRAGMVIIYFSGHSFISQDEQYFICSDTIDSEIILTSLSGKTFLEKISAINAEKMLIILDCCHAGGIGKKTNIPFNKDAFLNSGSNRVLLTACHKEQVSFLSKPVSLFTFALIEAISGKHLKKGEKNVNIFDLALYVRERVYTLSEFKQQPQLDVLEDGSTQNFMIARYPSGNIQPFFNEDFSLLDDQEKKINLSTPLKKDEDFRKKYIQFANTIYNIENIQVFNA